MTKNRGSQICLSQPLIPVLVIINIISSKIVAVIGKFDCRDFCHINSLRDKISNTAATIQPNPFGFGKNITVFSCFFP